FVFVRMVIGATLLVDFLLVCLVVGTGARGLLVLVGLAIGAGAPASLLSVSLIIGATARVPFGAIHRILRPSFPPLCVVSVGLSCCFLRHPSALEVPCNEPAPSPPDDVRRRASRGPRRRQIDRRGRSGLRPAAGAWPPAMPPDSLIGARPEADRRQPTSG